MKLLILCLISLPAFVSPKETWVLVDHALDFKTAREFGLEESFFRNKRYSEAALDKLKIAEEMMQQKDYPRAYWLYTDVLEVCRIFNLDLSDLAVPQRLEIARQAWWKSISDAEQTGY